MYNKGYTFLEITISLFIFALLFLGGYTAYREFIRREIIGNSATTLRNNLLGIRQAALTGEKPPGCGDSSLTGYKFSFSTNRVNIGTVYGGVWIQTGYRDDKIYTFEMVCSDGRMYGHSTYCIEGKKYVSRFGCANDITTTMDGPSSVIFKVLGQGTDLPSGTNLVITLTSSSGEKSTVTITSKGLIQ